jgi:Kef-type K+ transport system membrane component KefB
LARAVPLLTSLQLLIVTARLLGHRFARFKQPAIVGEMVAAVLLGPALFDAVRATPELHGIAALAVFLVVLSAGLEMNFKEVVGAMTPVLFRRFVSPAPQSRPDEPCVLPARS